MRWHFRFRGRRASRKRVPRRAENCEKQKLCIKLVFVKIIVHIIGYEYNGLKFCFVFLSI